MNKILQGDCLETLKTLPGQSVHCCVTSPPYWGLRDYGMDDQIGLEQTPEEFVAKLVEVFREVRRVLRDDGTLWLNLGDSYAGGGFGGHADNKAASGIAGPYNKPVGMKPKDLVGIPWMVAFALRADGWYLRQDIIWHKPNPMPESVTDRCTKAHEYIFLMTKNERYYYDAEAVKEAASKSSGGAKQRNNGVNTWKYNEKPERVAATGQRLNDSRGFGLEGRRNRRSVWTVTTKPYSGAHFATYPVDLITPCILAGTSAEGCCPSCGNPWERMLERVSTGKRYSTGKSAEKNSAGLVTGFSGYSDGSSAPEFRTVGWQPTCSCGGTPVPCTVLDPFMGAGTTAIAAVLNQRQYLGCELNPEYIEIAERRIQDECGLFLLGSLG